MNLWYVGYGSNLLPQGVTQYLSGKETGRAHELMVDATAPAAGICVEFPHPVHFAGHSKTWGGGVAFVDIHRRAGHVSYGRATRLTFDELHLIIERENGLAVELEDWELLNLQPGQSRLLQVELDPEGYRGKYNAVLRLENVLDEPAYTLTSNRIMVPNAPADRYLALIRTGLLQHVDAVTAEAYLQAARAYVPQL